MRNSAGNREHTARTYRLEVIELCVGLVRGLVLSGLRGDDQYVGGPKPTEAMLKMYLDKNLLEAREHSLLV